MINFRYHVVSLTAVFLALTIGLVVGTAALNGPVADQFESQVTAFSKQNSQLREQVTQAQEELNQQQRFATEIAPSVLAGKLAGRRLLLVVLPAAENHVAGIVTMLNTAGAKITGRIAVQDKFTDPANSVELLDLSERASQDSAPIANLPNNVDGVETSSALLATALLDRTPAVTPADQQAVLTAYTNAGYLTVEEKVTGPAEATVVIAGRPPFDRVAAAKNKATVTMLAQFAGAKPAVVACGDVGEGNLADAVRADPALVKKISTVDNAASVQGQVSTALATAELLTAGRTGQYGLAAGATGLVPSPVQ
ncbi:MAG TPA: copper transporter [Catenuloplanes sp.]